MSLNDQVAGLKERLDVEMALVPGGDFLYGDDKQTVFLDTFWISKTPVTNVQYKRFIDANKDYAVPAGWDSKNRTYPAGRATHPVVEVTWNDAKAYADWAGVALPTEQQWEKAARGTEGREYPWGDSWQVNRCNTIETGIADTTPVGQFSPQGDSPYGCVDMSGNVWEWTDSRYDEDKRVGRGGSWGSDANRTCAFCRCPDIPDYRSVYCGFRVAVRRPPSQ